MGIFVPSWGLFWRVNELSAQHGASKQYGICATRRCCVYVLTPIKWQSRGSRVEREAPHSPTWDVSVGFRRWLDTALHRQDLPGLFPRGGAAALPCDGGSVLQGLPSPCSSCFVLSHQEASRTALPRSLKFLTHGSRGLSETSRGCCRWEGTSGMWEAIPYSISVVWEGFENGVSWEKLSFCFCGCVFFLFFRL